ncbi:hypothetical protein DE4576_03259 [Mycobacterium marinum]|nr:hypothetical protein DE4576_03259 [Mycobacterium marinum]
MRAGTEAVGGQHGWVVPAPSDRSVTVTYRKFWPGRNLGDGVDLVACDGFKAAAASGTRMVPAPCLLTRRPHGAVLPEMPTALRIIDESVECQIACENCQMH